MNSASIARSESIPSIVWSDKYVEVSEVEREPLECFKTNKFNTDNVMRCSQWHVRVAGDALRFVHQFEAIDSSVCRSKALFELSC
jgi:hypothetical protein